MLVAGNVGFNSSKNSVLSSDVTNNYFNFSSKVGYQFSDNMTIGIESSLYSWKGTTNTIGNPISESKNNNLNLGAFLRYSKHLGDLFSVYGDLGAGFLSGKQTNTIGLVEKLNGFYVGLTPAIAMNIKKGFCLNFSIGGLGYSTNKNDAINPTKTNNFNFSFGQQPTIGISKNF